jgi:Galactose oxidase, central domain
MPRHRRPLFAAMAVALVLLGASACGTSDAGSRRAVPEGWRRLAAAPLSPRVGHSAVWTGNRLLVWGGRVAGGGARADGAAYDPAGDRWSRLPPAPVAGRFGHAAVWTGSELLVWGGLRPVRSGTSEVALADGAAYQPATRRWRPIAPAPFAGDTALWTGTELLAFGRVGAGPAARLGVAAYRPPSGRWRRLEASPLPAGDEVSLVLAGRQVAAFTYRDGERACHGGRYDLAAGTWRVLGACPLLPIMYPQPVWTGSRIVLLTWGTEWFDGGEVDPWPERVYTNGVYDPATDSWSRPAARPASL